MKRRAWLLSVLVGFVAGLVPFPAVAQGHPETLADDRALGEVTGSSAVVDSSFPVDYLGVSWTSGREPTVRFRHGGRWGDWQEVHQDEIPSPSRTYGALIAADDAEAYQVRGANGDVRAVAINTTDGPRSPKLVPRKASASHLVQPGLLSRAQWGADESYRFNADGTESWGPTAFFPTQKLIVHHTATSNNDRDPAATVRAIYRYHAIDQGWGDIGYNFLVDAQGRIYKGRYSGPQGTRTSDTSTGENPEGHGVTAGHTVGYNSGTMGIAVLGTYRSKGVSTAARSAVVNHLAWEAERHGLDPLASSLYTNPVNGSQKTNPNISGHRDWVSTECPGNGFYNQLPAIRQDVKAKVGTTAA